MIKITDPSYPDLWLIQDEDNNLYTCDKNKFYGYDFLTKSNTLDNDCITEIEIQSILPLLDNKLVRLLFGE